MLGDQLHVVVNLAIADDCVFVLGSCDAERLLASCSQVHDGEPMETYDD